jgi:hypothetical protein
MIMADKTPDPQTTAKKTAQKPAEDAPKRVRKEYAALDFGAIKVVPGTDRAALAKHRNTKGDRGEEQIAVDKLVQKAHERWQVAGSPESWMDCKDAAFTVQLPAHQIETFKFRVRKAALYLNVASRFGKDIDAGDGKVDLLFVIKDKKESDAKDADNGEKKS